MSQTSPELLTPGEVAGYLRVRGVIGDEPGRVVELGGGVSNSCSASRRPAPRVVLKQALPRLRVADEWLAKRERALAEARALRLARTLATRLVARPARRRSGSLRAHDRGGAERTGGPGRTRLLDGDVRSAVARRLGELLRGLARGTSEAWRTVSTSGTRSTSSASTRTTARRLAATGPRRRRSSIRRCDG